MTLSVVSWFSEVPDLDSAIELLRTVHSGLVGHSKCTGFLTKDIEELGSRSRLSGSGYETARPFILDYDKYRRAGLFDRFTGSSSDVLYQMDIVPSRIGTSLDSCATNFQGRAVPFAQRLQISFPVQKWEALSQQLKSHVGKIIPYADSLATGLRSYHQSLSSPIEEVALVLRDMSKLRNKILFRRNAFALTVVVIGALVLFGAAYLQRHSQN